jgi:hypothetical protein
MEPCGVLPRKCLFIFQKPSSKKCQQTSSCRGMVWKYARSSLQGPNPIEGCVRRSPADPGVGPCWRNHSGRTCVNVDQYAIRPGHARSSVTTSRGSAHAPSMLEITLRDQVLTGIRARNRQTKTSWMARSALGRSNQRRDWGSLPVRARPWLLAQSVSVRI